MPCIGGPQNSIYDFCDYLEWICTRSTPILIHIMFGPAAIIIFLTLIDRYSEDAKYFMLNTAVINIVTGIAWEMRRSNSFLSLTSYLNTVWAVGKDLSQYSIFLLAVTRVLILYYPNVYKKAFARKFLLAWIIGSDSLLAGISVLIYEFGLDISLLALGAFMLMATFSCSISVMLKIRKMQKIIGKSSQLRTFSDLRRASIVCLIQAISYTIYTALLIYMRLYVTGIITRDETTPVVLRILLHVFSDLQNPMFLLFTILDTLIPMILLTAYRRTIRSLCLIPYRLIRGRKNPTIIVTTDLTPRINNLVA